MLMRCAVRWALRPEHAPEIFALADAERQRLRTWLPWVDCTHAVADVEEGLLEGGQLPVEMGVELGHGTCLPLSRTGR